MKAFILLCTLAVAASAARQPIKPVADERSKREFVPSNYWGNDDQYYAYGGGVVGAGNGYAYNGDLAGSVESLYSPSLRLAPAYAPVYASNYGFSKDALAYDSNYGYSKDATNEAYIYVAPLERHAHSGPSFEYGTSTVPSYKYYSVPAYSYRYNVPAKDYSSVPAYKYTYAPAAPSFKYNYAAPSYNYLAPTVYSLPVPAQKYTYSAPSVSAIPVSYIAPVPTQTYVTVQPALKVVDVKKVVNVQREVLVPQVVQVKKVITEPKVITEQKLVPVTNDYYKGYGTPLTGTSSATAINVQPVSTAVSSASLTNTGSLSPDSSSTVYNKEYSGQSAGGLSTGNTAFSSGTAAINSGATSSSSATKSDSTSSGS